MKCSILALLLAMPGVAVAQTVVPPTVPAPVAATRVTLTTGEGAITIAVDTTHAPITAANFLRYVDGKRLDGTAFYRAVNVAPGYGLAQFGTRNDPKRTLPGIAHEPTTKTGLAHVDGAVSMAMATPGTAAGDFFVTVGDIPSMNADTAQPGFAVFGKVVEGMDVVRRILALPTSPTEGVGVMRGQMLGPVVKIVSARRAN